jgi:hypothetical protein
MKPQMPSSPPVLDATHALHCSTHGPVQHTPSAQWPLPHSAPEVHRVPFPDVATHTPAAQWYSSVQSDVSKQSDGQLALTPLHRYGLHAPSGLLPARRSVQTPSSPPVRFPRHDVHASEHGVLQQSSSTQ